VQSIAVHVVHSDGSGLRQIIDVQAAAVMKGIAVNHSVTQLQVSSGRKGSLHRENDPEGRFELEYFGKLNGNNQHEPVQAETASPNLNNSANS
jgi:hypothetical protein